MHAQLDHEKVVVVVHQFVRGRQPLAESGADSPDKPLIHWTELANESCQLSFWVGA
jgi:hypothetical protein